MKSPQIGRAFVALALSLSLAPAFAFAAEKTPPRDAGKEFDSGWTAYFGAEHFVYLAVRDVNLDGPLMHRPLDGASAAKDASPAGFMHEFLEDAKKEKIVEKSFTELTPNGFAAAAAAGQDVKKEPAILFVAPRTRELAKFHDWVIARYKKVKGGDAAVKEVTIEGAKGVQFLKSGKAHPVMVLNDRVMLLANQEDQIGRAIRRAKDGKETLSFTKYYKRGRTRVSPDAAVFLMIDPMPMLDAIEASAPSEEQKKKLTDAKKNFEAIDAILVQIAADKKASHVDLSVLLDPKSPSFDRFKALSSTKGVRSTGFVNITLPAYLALIRPKDIMASVADAQRAQLEQQIQTLKGMLQTQTGLDFDADVAPWWGAEIALGMVAPDGAQPPEGALIFETTDPKKSQEALDKVVRHISVAQNRTFADSKVGDVTVRTAGPGPQGPSPLNPSVATTKEFVILGTGPSIVNQILESKEKLTSTPAFTKLSAAVPANRLGFAVYLKTDVLVKATANPQGPTPPPNSPNAQFKKLNEEVDSILLGLGWPDDESVRLTVLFSGK